MSRHAVFSSSRSFFVRCVFSLGASAGQFTALDDASLLGAQRSVTSLRRVVDTYAAWIAAAIAKHSDRALGHAGMAISAGFVSVEALIQSISGSTRAEAAKLVQIGTLLAETEAAEALAAAASEAAAVFAEAHLDGQPGTDPVSHDPGAPAAPFTPTTGTPVVDPGSLAGAGPATDPAGPRFPVGMPVWQAPIARAVAAGRGIPHHRCEPRPHRHLRDLRRGSGVGCGRGAASGAAAAGRARQRRHPPAGEGAVRFARGPEMAHR